jgi:hypothetical protein
MRLYSFQERVKKSVHSLALNFFFKEVIGNNKKYNGRTYCLLFTKKNKKIFFLI